MDRKDFLALLKAVMPGVAKKDSLEQGKCFVFTDGMLVSFNNDTAVMHPVDLPFRGAVAAAELYGIVKAIKDDDITVEDKGGMLRISTADSKTTMALHSEIKLPIKEIPSPSEWVELPAKFDAALGVCSRCCPQVSGNPLVNYIMVDGPHMVTGDGVKVVCHALGREMPRFFIPGKVAKQVREYAPVAVSMVDGWLLFKNLEGVVFCCRTVSVDEEYPFVVGSAEKLPHQHRVEDLLDFDGVSVRFPERMLAAVEECRVMTKSKDNEEVTLRCRDGFVVVEGNGVVGSHKRRMPMEHGAPFNATMDPEALVDALHLGASFKLGESAMKVETEDYKIWLALLGE